jgi:hypothetical protein
VACLVANRFQKRRRRRVPGLLYVISLVLCAIALFELYRWIVPFRSDNPLFQEVTIGENVIDNWKYGGEDEEGYLRFYDDRESIVLPPSSRLFDANGQFVVIEHYSPSSLTYAVPFAAIPFKWFVAMFVVLVLTIGGVYLRFKNRPRKLAKQRPRIQTDEAMNMWEKVKPKQKPKRFQPKVSKSRWNSRQKP